MDHKIYWCLPFLVLIDVQGFFSVHFMAEIWLYSHLQIISFFPYFCPKIPNSKDKNMLLNKDFRGIKARENALLMGM